jgi:hypothetical protein
MPEPKTAVGLAVLFNALGFVPFVLSAGVIKDAGGKKVSWSLDKKRITEAVIISLVPGLVAAGAVYKTVDRQEQVMDRILQTVTELQVELAVLRTNQTSVVKSLEHMPSAAELKYWEHEMQDCRKACGGRR